MAEIIISDGSVGVAGTTLDDTATFNVAANGTKVNLNKGNDILNLGNFTNTVILDGVEEVNGGTGLDTVTFNSASVSKVKNAESITGSGSNDYITLTSPLTTETSIKLGKGTDVLYLGNDANTGTVSEVEYIYGGTSRDDITISGLEGSELYTTLSGIEKITGGVQHDTVALRTAYDGDLDLKTGLDKVILAKDTNNQINLFNTESLIGNNGSDNISVKTQLTQGVFDLSTGTDSLTLGNFENSVSVAGAETIIGGAGFDTVTLTGASKVNISDVEKITGSSSYDTVTLNSALTSNMSIDLGANKDTLTLSNSSNIGTISGVEYLNGGTGVDEITLTGAVNVITSTNVERIIGGNGEDTLTLTTPYSGDLNMGEGKDKVILGSGVTEGSINLFNTESFVGNANNNSLTIKTEQTGNIIDLGSGNDTVALGNFTNTLFISNAETINGGTGQDAITFFGNSNITTISNVENIIGGAGSENITLTEGLTSLMSIDLKTGTDTLNLTNTNNTGTISGVEYLNGGTGLDDITLSGAANAITVTNVEKIKGGEGIDNVTIKSSYSGDLDLGAGIDKLTLSGPEGYTMGISNIETLTASKYDDILTMKTLLNKSILDLSSGNDTLNLGNFTNDTYISGAEIINGGSDSDTVRLFGTNKSTISNVENIYGGTGSDNVTLTNQLNTSLKIDLGTGADTLNLSNNANTGVISGVEYLNGGTGLDDITLSGAANAITVTNVEKIKGGEGIDKVYFSGNYTGDLDLAAGVDTVTFGKNTTNEVNTFNIENIVGNTGTDIITAKTVLDNKATVNLGYGTDTLNLGNFTNNFYASGIETINGGTGTDTVSFYGSNITTISNVENILGGTGADKITMATELTNSINVNLGNGSDTLTLGNFTNTGKIAGVEFLVGGTGLDTITLSDSGNKVETFNIEKITGGAAADTVSLNGNYTGDLNLGLGVDKLILNGTDYNYNVNISGVEVLVGSKNSDIINVTDKADKFIVDLYLGTEDVLNLGNFDNTLSVSGAEIINGGSGIDTVTFFGSNNTTIHNIENIVGGTGSDYITMTSSLNSDKIIDLKSGYDKLTLDNNGNTGSIGNIEYVSGGTGIDDITLTGISNFTAFENVEKITGGTGADIISLKTSYVGDLNLKEGADIVYLAKETTSNLNAYNVETVIGDAGNDTINVKTVAERATYNLGYGTDTVNLGNFTNTALISGAEIVAGGSGIDTVLLFGTNETTISSVENIYGGLGTDKVTLSDQLTSTQKIDLGSGLDTLNLGNFTNTGTISGVDYLNGGTGTDDITLSGLSNRTIVTNVEKITGSAGTDYITLNSNYSGDLDLGAGVDKVIFNKGESPSYNVNAFNIETIIASYGADTINVKTALNKAVYELNLGIDTVNLGNFTNIATISGAEFINGGTGIDTITLGGSSATTISNVENILGTSNQDTVILSTQLNADMKVELGAGIAQDKVTLGDFRNTGTISGAETIIGGTGDDNITIKDIYKGTFNLGEGSDTINLGLFDGRVDISGVESLTGGGFNSTVYLTNASNITVSGFEGILIGSTGNDVITFDNILNSAVDAGNGNDTIYLTQGNEVDLIQYQLGEGSDTIYNFDTSKDGINISNYSGLIIDTETKSLNTSSGSKIGSYDDSTANLIISFNFSQDTLTLIGVDTFSTTNFII